MNMNKQFLLKTLTLSLYLVGVCSHAALFDDEEARRAIARTDQNVRTLETRLRQTEEAVKNQVDALSQLESFRQELAQLRGQVELLQNDVEKLKQTQRDFYTDIDQRLKTVESSQQAINTATAQSTKGTLLSTTLPNATSEAISTDLAAPPLPPIPPASPEIMELLKAWRPSPANEKKQYDAAIGRWKADQHAEAIPMLIYFAMLYPNNPQSPAALYRAGLSARVTKSPALAKDAFEKIIQQYPTNPFAPKALFMLGQVLQEQGDQVGAQRLWKNILTHYPRSEMVDRAKQALKTLPTTKENN